MTKRVSGATAMRGWECSMSCSSVVPERGHPMMKIGRSDSNTIHFPRMSSGARFGVVTSSCDATGFGSRSRISRSRIAS